MAFLENSRRMIWRVGCGGVVLFNVSVRVGCVVYRVCFIVSVGCLVFFWWIFTCFIYTSSSLQSDSVARLVWWGGRLDAHAWWMRMRGFSAYLMRSANHVTAPRGLSGELSNERSHCLIVTPRGTLSRGLLTNERLFVSLLLLFYSRVHSRIFYIG